MIADHLLVVVADDVLRRRLTRALEEQGHTVQAVGDAGSALARLDGAPDGLIIAVDLPDADGRDLRQALRARGVAAPALLLSPPAEPADPRPGDGGGSDDVLTTPVDVDEALTRVRALLRLRRATTPTSPDALELDAGRRAVRGERGAEPLTPTEFRVLKALAERRGSIVRRDEIVRAAWPADASVADNSLDQYITRLRAKLARVTDGATIVTTRGVGYRLQ